jgi:hypothetical protein
VHAIRGDPTFLSIHIANQQPSMPVVLDYDYLSGVYLEFTRGVILQDG